MNDKKVIINELESIKKSLSNISLIWDDADEGLRKELEYNYTLDNDLRDLIYQVNKYRNNLENRYITADGLFYEIQENTVKITQRNITQELKKDTIRSFENINFNEVKIEGLELKKRHIDHILDNLTE